MNTTYPFEFSETKCNFFISDLTMYGKRGCILFWKRKKGRKFHLHHAHIKYTQRSVGLSEYDYIRKMLNKKHLGKVPSKAAVRWKMKGPYNTTGY